jgi:geranylgeranyl pyrophosphate synthase
LQKDRRPKENIPQTRGERESVRSRLRTFVAEQKPVPPLSLPELRALSERFVAEQELDPIYTDYVAVVLNSEVWRDQLASVPYERRLLLLPKCMRIEEHCPAPFDELGLLCKQCGQCSIQDLQEEAERLGYAVLVAEGSALVTAIIATGRIEAIVGVSCLSVLEKAFPYMEAAAIPGVAVPLLQDDCKDVTVDLEWIWEIIHLNRDDHTHRLNLDTLRDEVKTWFSPASLDAILGPATGETERIARHELSKHGKRWRPFLTVCAWRALQEQQGAAIPSDLKKLAVAVECFHKASLIHDDIEDGDDLRYGEATAHADHGLAVALNVGDLLIGEGYRLIGECQGDAATTLAMLRAAADGHRTLCLGQGAELTWARKPVPLDSLAVLDIFRRKTAPAFEVALQLGACFAGGDEETAETISRYSEALGIAYQIRDDLDDLENDQEPDDIMAMRPSLPLAVLYERTKAAPAHRALAEKAWRREASPEELAEIRKLLEEYEVPKRCRILQESYKEQAIRTLGELESASLKGLLRRVISKIFVIEVEGWCREFESRNAASRPALAQAAG